MASNLDQLALETCHRLAAEFKAPCRVNEAVPGAVSIGIEVEVPWSSYFPALWLKYRLNERKISAFHADELLALSADCSAIEASLLPRLQRTVECGVPRGNDRYWEFAFSPVHDTRLLVEQVRLITAAGLMPRDRKHSLQVTVGDIPPCVSMYYLAMLLEVEFVDPQRVLAGIEETRKTIHTGWARKGRSGLYGKGPADLVNGCQVASEIRMLQLPVDDHELARLMSIVHWGVNAIHDLRAGLETDGANQWSEFEAGAADALRRLGLPTSNWDRGIEGGGIRYDIWARFSELMVYLKDELNELLDVDQLGMLGKRVSNPRARLSGG